jgi:hypothetical protein
MGSEQSSLEVMHLEKPVLLCGEPMANIMDCKPMINIKPFGQCSSLTNPVVAAATSANYGRLQKMPCIPNVVSPWFGGKMDLIIKGAPALLSTSGCTCLWGCPIKITDPGQDTVYDGGPMTISITDPTMETLQSLEGMGGDVAMQGALGSGFLPAGLQPMGLQTAIGGIRLPQIPSFVTEMKDSAETLLQKAVGAIESGKGKSNDIRSSAKADKDNIAKELKEKAESKCKEIESYKAIVDVKDDVDGKAFQGQKITYEAIICGKDGHVNEECDVRWAIKVGENGNIDKDELKSKCGKSIVLNVKPEWADKKEITIMPYLNSNSPDEGTSKKTKVEKWELPKIVIETKETEGIEWKQKEGREHKQIARDMHFGLGEGNEHTDSFKLDINLCDDIKNGKLIKSHKELREAIEKDLKYDDEELFDRLRNLIEWASTGDLQTANLQFVEEMKKLNSTLNFVKEMKSLRATNIYDYIKKQEKRSNATITKEAFKHKDTKRLIDNVQKDVIEIIKDLKGDINKIEKIIPYTKELKKPQYSEKLDSISGLSISVHDTWGYRVEIIDYKCNVKNRKFEGKLAITIFDHFGLDYGDIKGYGTKLPPFKGEGFRAWFILQHYRGYRPFINIMKNNDENVNVKIEIKGQW